MHFMQDTKLTANYKPSDITINLDSYCMSGTFGCVNIKVLGQNYSFTFAQVKEFLDCIESGFTQCTGKNV